MSSTTVFLDLVFLTGTHLSDSVVKPATFLHLLICEGQKENHTQTAS